MIKIHHAQGSRSTRVLWLCEELGLDYELETYRIGGSEMRSPEFKKLHPLLRVPVLEIDGRVMFESLAIMQFLLERFGEGRLEPVLGDPARMAYLQWLHFAEGTAMVPLGDLMRASIFTPEDKRDPALIAGAVKRLGHVKQALEGELAAREYIAGDVFSAADIALGYFFFLAKMVGHFAGDATPALAAYYDRLTARPAYQRAVAR